MISKLKVIFAGTTNNTSLKSGMQLPLMVIISLVTQVVVLSKTSIMASLFGVNPEVDAYNVVLNITTFIFSFLATGVTTILIPAYVKKTNDDAVNSFLTLIYFVSIILSLIIILIQKGLWSFFSNGNEVFASTASSIILLLLISQFFNTYLGVTTAYFQILSKYNIPKVCTLITSVLLVVLMIINKRMTIIELSIYTAGTAVLNAVIQSLLAKKYGMTYHIKFNYKSFEFKEMLMAYIPTIFSAGLYQINLLLNSLISTKIGTGNVTILSYANSFVGMINSVLILNLLIYIYPKLSKLILKDEEVGKRSLLQYIVVMNFFVCGVLIAYVAVGKDFLGLLLLHGRFTSHNLDVLFICILIYILGFPLSVTRDLFYRYFYAKGNTKATFYNSVTVSVINLVLSILLALIWGVFGIILGSVIGSLISAILIIKKFKQKYGIDKKQGLFYLTENVKIIISAILVIILIIGVKYLFTRLTNNIFINLIIMIIAGLIYFYFMYFSKSKLLSIIQKVMRI